MPPGRFERAVIGLAAIPVVTGAMSVALGSTIIPGGDSTAAGVESELRFYAASWMGFGVLLGLAARRIEERSLEFRVLCGVLFAGGVARALAIAHAGWPPPGLVVLMGVELALPVVLLAWHARVLRARSAQAPASRPADRLSAAREGERVRP